MIWHVLLHAIGVFVILFFTFVNTTTPILNICLALFNAVAVVLVEAVSALLTAIVDGIDGVFEASYQVRVIRDYSHQLSPEGIAFPLHDDNYNHDFSGDCEDSDDEKYYDARPALARAPAPDHGRRPDSEQQRRISPRTLGPDGRVPGEDAPPPFNPGPFFPTRRRTTHDGLRRRRGAIDHGRPELVEITAANINREPSQPMDIPATERGRRHTIPGAAPPNDDENDLLVRRPPRPPGPFELRSSPETMSISRAYRQGQPLPTFRYRNEQSPSPTYVRLRTVNTATGQAHEAPRHVSDHAIIEQGDAVSDAGAAEGSTGAGRAQSHDAHQTAGAEADEIDTGESREASQERTDTVTDLRRLAAVLNSRLPQQQDPEVRMVIDVPEPRDLVVSEEGQEAIETEEAQATPTVEVSEQSQGASKSLTHSEPQDGSAHPPTPQETRDRRYMRATIAQATERSLRPSTEAQESPPSMRPPSSASTISDRPFVRSNSPSPPSPPTPTPRPRKRSGQQGQAGVNKDKGNNGEVKEAGGGRAEVAQNASTSETEPVSEGAGDVEKVNEEKAE